MDLSSFIKVVRQKISTEGVKRQNIDPKWKGLQKDIIKKEDLSSLYLWSKGQC